MKRTLLLSLFGIAATGALLGQTAGEVIIDRVQQGGPPPAPGTPAPVATQSESGDLDGGTQRIAEARRLPFRLMLGYDVQAFYTNNVFLSATDKVESVIVANTIQARAEFNSVPVGDGLLTPSAGLVIQRFNHALCTGDQQRQNLDFDAYSIPLSLRLRHGNWEFGLGVTGTAVYSLEGPPSYNLTYQSLTTNLSARKFVSLGKNQLLVVGGSVGYALTEADTPGGPFDYRDDRNDKIDTVLDVAYYYVTGRWVLSPYSRLVHSNYRHYQEAAFNDVDREDLTFSLGLGATYNFTRWASARAFTSYDWRKPQGDSFVDYGYDSANLGLGLSLNIQF